MMTVRALQPKTIPIVYTIGHSTRPITEFLALLEQVAVNMLVDVRSIPRSRTNSQFNADALPETLSVAGYPTGIYQLLAVCGTTKKVWHHRSIPSGASPPSETMRITLQLKCSAPD
jgi:hypothetical protein